MTLQLEHVVAAVIFAGVGGHNGYLGVEEKTGCFGFRYFACG